MRWLYRLQTRVGLTGPEATAALVLLGALAAGLVAGRLRSASEPVPADLYAAADAAFAAADGGRGGAAPPAQTGAAPPAETAPANSLADAPAAQVAAAEVAAAAAPRRASKPPPAPTNLNTASAADLQRLPGIGPALAGRIVAYRETNGPFRSPDQIVEVKGIGDKTFEKLAPWLHL
ncbi:helix-hairpin-helix domain-containing protein [Rubrivirga sp. S365]|uniref:Helix-hairpin-helix domain-containing protein n=1 Tax=Rubrivirga litoralis TaxID=3075598 RepID=A0ABU3BLW7_9BACT|nr:MULTISPECIES: helix-hairpin-helix domain-containing protein [unclassified Rubrivirga]MDT0630284.1 helix-hairpin-helix domain-containing protein [Rubrivirga sp. F394]MDT7855796.1 helix-hairpin-helix domain-containing protein [Rubrivirga sp. S365]